MNLIKLSVSHKILLLFLVISILTIGFSFFIGSPLIEETGQKAAVRSSTLGEKAVEDSSAALTASAKRELLSLAGDRAEITNLYFVRYNGYLHQITEAAGMHLAVPPPPPGEMNTVETRPENPGTAALMHLVPGAGSDTGSEEAVYLSGMDDVCIPLIGTDTNIDSVYIGSDSGLIRIYPWTGILPDSYDHRVRPWYILANQAGGISWTDPYVDSRTETLMMTGAIPIRSPDHAYSWVAGLDVRVKTLNQLIGSTDTSHEGYAFLINSKGEIIVKPGQTVGGTRWDEPYLVENLLNSSSSDLRDVAGEMISQRTGVRTVRFAEGEKIIAYAPISSMGWSIGIVRPLSSVLAPVNQTEELIRSEMTSAAVDITTDKQEMLNRFLLGSILLLLLVSLLAFVFSRYITRPIGVLMDATRVIGSGDLSTQVTLHTGDEFEELGNHFNRMSENLTRVMETLRRTTAEKERYSTELDIAREIQQSFLPQTIPVTTGLEMAARSVMAREVGGDFFDIFPFEVIRLHTSRLIMMIADVSGKGVPAALFMALARIVIRVNASWYDEPSDVINAANTIISRESPSGMFVTTFYADYEEANRRLRFVNAGHNPPILLRNRSISLLEGTGLAIGIMPGFEYGSGTVDLNPGDLLVFYTDGVTEAVNPSMELFGEDRLNALLLENADLPADGILETIINSVYQFAEGRPQEDDITLIIMKVI